jgi:hypothetical protein
VIRLEFYDEDRKNPNRRCLAWENTVLVQARTREQAYRKAAGIGRRSEGDEAWIPRSGRKGAWRFEGLTSLLPVYDQIEDGVEVLWKQYENVAVRSVQSRVKQMRELDVFNDELHWGDVEGGANQRMHTTRGKPARV